MDVVDGLLGVLGLLLVFVLPGYTVTRATFPEWRVRGPAAGLVAVQLAALTLVTSVALTVLLGFALLVLPGDGFQSTWSDPVLEGALAGVAVLALAVGFVRGAYARAPPTAPAPEPAPGADDGWPLLERMQAIDRERRRIRHALRTHSSDWEAAPRQREVLEQLDRDAERIRREREAEYGR
jgi:hypothetical protein